MSEAVGASALLGRLGAAEDAAAELVRSWLEDGVPPSRATGSVVMPLDGEPMTREDLAVRLAFVAIGACRAAGDAVRVAIPPGEPALQAVLQAGVSVCRRLAEVTAHDDLAGVSAAAPTSRACLAAAQAIVDVLGAVAHVPMADRATSSEAGGDGGPSG